MLIIIKSQYFTNVFDFQKKTQVQAYCFFNLILSLENTATDSLKVLDLVKVYNNNIDKNGLNSTGANSNEANTKLNSSSNNNNNLILDDKTDPLGANKLTLNETQVSPIAMSSNNLTSPINMITNAGCTTTVLAVSGINTNLLMNSSALGMSQIANLNTIAQTNNNVINGRITNTTILPTFNKAQAWVMQKIKLIN